MLATKGCIGVNSTLFHSLTSGQKLWDEGGGAKRDASNSDAKRVRFNDRFSELLGDHRPR